MIIFAFYFSFIHFIKALDIYVAPLNILNPCQSILYPLGSAMCNGNLTSPFDNLQIAFQSGVQMANFRQDFAIIFNLISDGSVRYPLDSDPTNLKFISPFEYFSGNISIRGFDITSFQTNLAIIWLRTEHFYFRIQGSLAFTNISIVGIDMHIDTVPCNNRPIPNPILCSCGFDTNLYDPTSICSIQKDFIPLSSTPYNGFIQLTRTSTLIFNLFLLYNFNSFVTHITFIYATGQSTMIKFNNFLISQAYFAKSFINSDSKSIQIDIFNVSLTNINQINVIDLRSDGLSLINIKNSNGIINIFNIQIIILFYENRKIFLLDGCSIFLNILNIQIINFVTPANSFLNIFEVINADIIHNSTFVINGISINSDNILFLIDSYTVIHLNDGILIRSHSQSIGPYCSVEFNNIFWDHFCQFCGDSSVFIAISTDFDISINNSLMDNSENCFIMFYNKKVNFKSYNLTLLNSDQPPIINNNLDTSEISLFELIQLTLINTRGQTNSFLRTYASANIIIKDSNFLLLIADIGAGGIFLVIGNNNNIYTENLMVNFSISFAVGSIFSCPGTINNEITLNNSIFLNINSELMGNILGENVKVTIINSFFYNMTSKMGSFIYASLSSVFLQNVTVVEGETTNDGFILITRCEIHIIDCNFTALQASSGTFVSGIGSNIFMDNVRLDLSSSTVSFIFVSISNLSILNSKFSSTIGGVLILGDTNNTINISKSNFINSSIYKNGLIYLKTYNVLIIENSVLENINSKTSGAACNANQDNKINIINSNITNIIAIGKGIFFIYRNSFLVLQNCSFFRTESDIGGVAYGSLAHISIQGCIFQDIQSKDGGLFYLNYTFLIFDNSIIRNTTATKGASVISAIKSNIIITNSQFIKISHPASLNGLDYSMISILNKGLLDIDNILCYNNYFIGDGLNSGYLLYFEGVDNITLLNNVFDENLCTNQMISFIDSGIYLENLNFTGNEASIIIGITNRDNSIKLNVMFNSLKFDSNIVDANLISIQGNITLNLLNLFMESNIINLYCLINLINLEEFNSSNLIINNNSGILTDFSNDEYIFLILNSKSIFLTNIEISNNDFQFLNCLNSNLTISKLNALNNSISVFISIVNSYFWLMNSNFSGITNKISECYIHSICNSSTIFLYKSYFNIINTTFINLQKAINYSQYEIAIFESSFLYISSVRFINDISYSIYVKNSFYTSINSCVFEIIDINLKKNNTLGIVFIDNTIDQNDTLIVNNSQFINLGSSQSLSPIHYNNMDSGLNFGNITIINCNFLNNTAAIGGAYSSVGLTKLTIENSYFSNNKAIFISTGTVFSGVGGSIYSSCLRPYGCVLDIIKSGFSMNIADSLGGGIFLQNYKISDSKDLNFTQNIAVFLSNNTENSYMSSPYFINITEIQVANEQKQYFVKENQTNNISLNNKQNAEMIFNIYDLDNNLVNYSLSAIASLKTFNSTLDFIEKPTIVDGGQISFIRFLIKGKIKANYLFQLEVKGKFNLLKNVTFYMRECMFGEYFDKNQETCYQCQYGSYSLKIPQIISNIPFEQEGSIICNKCPDNSECEGSKIAPLEDYWLNNSNLSTEIVKCPLSGTCLYKPFDSFTLPMKCALGYKGPLCIVCDDGYAKDSYLGKCSFCQADAPQILIILAKMLFMIIFVSYQINSVLFQKFQNDTKISGILIKIIRDHLNQIFIIYNFCDIFQINENFFSFYTYTNDIVTGTAMNFDCLYSQSNNLDIFYFKTITLMISPLILQVFVSIVFYIFFLLKRYVLKHDVYFSYYLKTIIVAFIVICDTQFAQILMAFLKLFECVPLDSTNPNTFIRFAPHIQCYTSDHMHYALLIGLPCLIIWIIGLPIGYFIVLLILKKRVKKGEDLLNFAKTQRTLMTSKFQTKKSVGVLKTEESKGKNDKLPGAFELDLDAALMLSFLFYDYKKNRYYWTSVILIWKTLISIFVAFIPQNSIYMSLFSLYIVLMLIYDYGVPYNNKSTMLLANLSFFCNMISISLGQYISDEKKYKEEVSLINLLVHLFFFVYAIYLFLKEFEYQEILSKILKILQKKENNKFAKKVLDKLKNYDKYNIVQKTDNPQITEEIKEILSPDVYEMKEITKEKLTMNKEINSSSLDLEIPLDEIEHQLPPN